MKKYDCVIIGDSFAAIHAAVKSADSGLSVLLVRQDVFPVEIHETSMGVFECDLAAGCDLSCLDDDTGLHTYYGFKEKPDILRYPYRTRTPSFSLNEPGKDEDFLRELPAKFPTYAEAILRFYMKISYLHNVIDEIEAKTGKSPRFYEAFTPGMLAVIDPVTYSVISRLSNTSFKSFLMKFNLPDELLIHYNLLCQDHTGFSLDSIDAITGSELITRRKHGLSHPSHGWICLRDTMLERLRRSDNVRIIGGKKLDTIKTSAGYVYEITIDDRDTHPVNWLIIDETVGVLKFSGYESAEGRYQPLGYYSPFHVDFRYCVGWINEPAAELPVGVNFLYRKLEFPPHAPHMIRADVMPVDQGNDNQLRTRITIRGRYPAERVITSTGRMVSHDEIRNELLTATREFIQLPPGEPDFAELILPRSFYNPFGDTIDEDEIISPEYFTQANSNVHMLKAAGVNGANLRLAFRSVERIVLEINRRLRREKMIEDIALKPVQIVPAFREAIHPESEGK